MVDLNKGKDPCNWIGRATKHHKDANPPLVNLQA